MMKTIPSASVKTLPLPGLVVFLALFLLLAAGRSQADSPVASVPPASQWSLEIDMGRNAKSGNLTESEEALPLRLKATIDPTGIEKRELVLSDGNTQVIYIVRGISYQEVPGSQQVLALSGSGLDLLDPEDFRVPGFPATAWISGKTLVGREDFQGVPCLRFHQPPSMDVDGAGLQEMTAWIREADRFPVRIQAGDSTFDFSPVTRFNGSVSLRSAILRKVRSMARQNEALQKLRSKGVVPAN